MGETKTRIRVSGLSDGRSQELEVLVDTGATYTAIRGEILKKLNIKRTRKVRIEFANGKTEFRYIGDVFLEVRGIKVPNPVIFAEKRDACVLGVVTLESCGLMVDPIRRELIKVRKIHHY